MDDGGHDIFVTCYPRTKEPKLFIQSKSQYGNDIYVTNELPRLFSEVNKEASRGSIGVAGVGARGAGVGPAAGLRGGRQEAAADSGYSGRVLRKSARQTSLVRSTPYPKAGKKDTKKTAQSQPDLRLQALSNISENFNQIKVDKIIETVVESIVDVSMSV